MSASVHQRRRSIASHDDELGTELGKLTASLIQHRDSKASKKNEWLMGAKNLPNNPGSSQY